MTYDMGQTDKLAQFKEELGRGGIRLLPPDINKSMPTFVVEEQDGGGRAIRYALAAIKGVGRAAMETLTNERTKNGLFKDLRDLLLRCDSRVLNKKQLEQLAMAGAFDSLNDGNRAEIIENIDRLLRFASTAADDRDSGQVSLFAGAPAENRLQLQETKRWDPLTLLTHEGGGGGLLPVRPSAGPVSRAARPDRRLSVDRHLGLRQGQRYRFRQAGGYSGGLSRAHQPEGQPLMPSPS